jgi:hypothetical protein
MQRKALQEDPRCSRSAKFGRADGRLMPRSTETALYLGFVQILTHTIVLLYLDFARVLELKGKNEIFLFGKPQKMEL